MRVRLVASAFSPVPAPEKTALGACAERSRQPADPAAGSPAHLFSKEMSSIFFKKNFLLDKSSATPSETSAFIINPLAIKITRNLRGKEMSRASLRRLENEV